MKSGKKHFHNRLQLHRKLLRLKQRHVASLLGLHSTAQLSQWENGVSMPSAIHLMQLAIIYRTIPYELYYEHFRELKEEISIKERELTSANGQQNSCL